MHDPLLFSTIQVARLESVSTRLTIMDCAFDQQHKPRAYLVEACVVDIACHALHKRPSDLLSNFDCL